MKELTDTRHRTIPSDAPITRASDDLLERDRLAKLLANRLRGHRADHALTVGICGPWGSGKTSFMNLIREHLTEDPNVVRVGLSTWVLAQEPQLAARLLAEIAAQYAQHSLAANAKATAIAMWKVVRRTLPLGLTTAELFGVPYAGSVKTALGSAPEPEKDDPTRSTEALIAEISEALRASGKLLVVTLDDLDRLPDDRIQEVFRLIAVLGNFANTVYLLALDRKRVAEALSNAGFGDGDAYLEKVLTLVYDLPEPPPESIYGQFCAGVERELEGYQFPDELEVGPSFRRTWHGALRHLIRHPRDVPRILAGYSMALEAVHDITHPIDLLCIEAVRVVRPSAHQAVRDRGRVYLESKDNGDLLRELVQSGELEVDDDGEVEHKGDAVARFLVNLCTPDVFAGARDAATLHRCRRLASPQHFDHYFRWSGGKLAWTDAEMWRALEGLVTATNDAEVAEWSERVDDRLIGWLVKLANYPETLADRPDASAASARVLQAAHLAPEDTPLPPAAVDTAVSVIRDVRAFDCPPHQGLMMQSEVRSDVTAWMAALLDAFGDSHLVLALLALIEGDCGPDRRSSLDPNLRSRVSGMADAAFQSGALKGHPLEFEAFRAWRGIALDDDERPHRYLAAGLPSDPERIWRVIAVPMKLGRTERPGPEEAANRLADLLDTDLLARLYDTLADSDPRRVDLDDLHRHLRDVHGPASRNLAFVRDVLVEIHLDSDAPVHGSRLRTSIHAGSSRQVTDKALRMLEALGHVTAIGARPKETYRPTVEGLLTSRFGAPTRALAGALLVQWKLRAAADELEQGVGWDALKHAAGVDGRQALTIINLCRLGYLRSSAPVEGGLTFVVNPPDSIEEIVGLASGDEWLSWLARGGK